MFTHLKNYIENNRKWNTKRVIFVDFKNFNEVEFLKDNGNYFLKVTDTQYELKEKIYSVDKKVFYNKLKTMINETIFKPNHYKLQQYNEYDTLLSLWFNM